MHVSYQLNSIEEISKELILEMKKKLGNGPINLFVEQNEEAELSESQRKALDERLEENKADYISKDELFERIASKYGI
jgi:hypothetical protein